MDAYYSSGAASNSSASSGQKDREKKLGDIWERFKGEPAWLRFSVHEISLSVSISCVQQRDRERANGSHGIMLILPRSLGAQIDQD